MNEFISVIEELILLFEHLNVVEQEKLEATKKNRVTFVEDCMTKEQAAILKLRGLDKKRESCQARLGFEGYTFKQILESVPGEQHGVLKELFDSLSYQIKLFKDVSESAKAMIELNLHTINKAIAQSQQTAKTKTNKAQWEGVL